MDCSTPGFLVHHQLPEPTQTHVHCIGDAIQPSHPLLANTHAWKSLGDLPKCEQQLYLGGEIMGDLFLLPVSYLYFLTLV